MSKRICQFYILLFIILFLSCNKNKYNDVHSFSLKDIPEHTYLKGEIIELDEIFMPVRLFIKDSLLFTINSRHRSFISVFNLHDMKKIGDFLSFGNGPNEVLHINHIQFTDSIILVFDPNRKQINKYPINQFLEEQEVVPVEIIKMEESFQNIIVTKDKMITYSLHHIQSRFSIYDLSGKFIENKGKLPDSGDKKDEFELFESFFCNMVLNPNDESIFIAYMNTDLIEIYDSVGNLKSSNHGPDHFFPQKKQISSGDQVRVRSIEGVTRDAYFNPVAFEDEIWTIYDGKYFIRNTERGDLNNTIIIFDWKGNPIRHYTTDISFFSLAIDRKNKCFYGITLNPDYCFVKFYY